MTAAESKPVPSTPVATPPGFPPAPIWRRALLFGAGAGVGIRICGPDLHVAVARVRPNGATNNASFTIRDFRTRPAAEWRNEYRAADVAATVLLPRSEVIVRVAHFPGVADKDMRPAIELELDTLHPYGDEPVNWAWSRIAPPKTGAVVIGIVRTTTLERYETLFREAGIPVSGITFSASAIHSALRLYSLPPAEFLTWANEDEIYGESPSRALFSAETGPSIPSALALGAAELRLPESAQALPLDSILPQPASGLDPLVWSAALAGAAPTWLSGYANLLPPELRKTVSRGRLIPTFVLAACVIAVMIALALEKQFAERRYLHELNQQIDHLQPLAARTNSIDRHLAQIKARVELLDRFRARTKDDIDIVNELTRLLPPPVWIGTLEIHPDNVVIYGEADQAAPLLKVIDSSPIFRNSEFAMPVSRNGQNETFRIKIMRRKPQ